MTLLVRLGLALFLSVSVIVIAMRRGSLSRSGAAAALPIGTLVLGLGGAAWGVLLGLFFISSSVLSHFKEDTKKVLSEKFAKGHQRDFGQVLANGGLGAFLALLSILKPSPVWFALFVGVTATVTADTWATELGTLNRTAPRLITTGKRVPIGTSGGVTLFGTGVSLLGGLLIGAAADFLGPFATGMMTILGGVSGLCGSLADSFLGATVQGVYYSDRQEKETEKRFDQTGAPNRLLRGFPWITNDLVNLIASCCGGIVSLIIYRVWTALQ